MTSFFQSLVKDTTEKQKDTLLFINLFR